MRKFTVSLSLCLLSLFLMTSFTLAQSSANYNFGTTTTGSFLTDLNSNPIDMSTGTTTLFSGYNDDVAGAVLNIGFDFFLMGNKYQQFSVSSNGMVALSATGTTVTGTTYTVSSGTTTTPIISPVGGDIAMNLANGKVHYKIIGSAPNRTLVIQFENMTLLYLTTPGQADGTYQARLYESSGRIEFVYGAMSRNAGTSAGNSQLAAIGFATNTTTNNLLAITSSTNTHSVTAPFTQNTYAPGSGAIPSLNSGADGTKRTYVISPVIPTAPTALNFTAVTTTGMTLNWTDNSSNETGFAIYRSDDGGTTYNYITKAAAGVVSSVQSGMLPGVTYFWRVYAVSEGGLSTVLAGSQSTVAGASIVSNGTGGGSWSSGSSWLGGVPPTSADDVVILAGDVVQIDPASSTINALTVFGTLRFDGVAARTLIVNTSINIAGTGDFNAGTGNFTNILNIGGTTSTAIGVGSLIVDGSFNAWLGAASGKMTISFFGLQNASIAGSGTINFNTTNIINKGTTTATANIMPPVLELLCGYTVQSATALGFITTHTAGVVKFSSTFILSNPVYTAVGYTIPALGGLWINNPNFTVAGLGGSPTVNGLLKLTAGTLNVGTATGNAMGASATATFLFEGGTSNFTGRFQNGSACVFNMSGGTMNVCTIGNAASASASFGLTSATASVTMSGGTINLVQATGGAIPIDWRVAAPIIGTVGTTLNIGTAATTATARIGFRLIGSAPNVNIDNTGFGKTLIDTVNTTAGAVIYGNMTVNAGCVWNINNASAGTYTVFMVGPTLTNNGIIQGTGINTRFDFQGPTAQTYGGAGTFGTNATPILGVGIGISNINGVTFNSTVISNRYNLFTGTLVNSNFAQIGGGGSAACFVQRGGSTGNPSGAFDQAPVFNTGTGTLSYSYSTASTAVTTSFEIPASRIVSTITLNNINGITLAGGNLSMSLGAAPLLVMTLGSLDLGGNTLTVGTSATTLGQITNTSGVIMNGTLTRWFGTTASPTAIANSNGGHFPMGGGTFAAPINRNLWLSFSAATALSTGGTISVTHNPATGIVGVSGYDDGGYTVDTRTNMNWTLVQSGLALTGTINARMQGSSPGFAVGTVANLRMVRASDALGTYSAGTNTASDPQVNRTGLDLTMLANTFYIGANSSDMSVLITWTGTTGSWSDPTNWSSNPSLPGASDNISISPASASVITVDGSYAVNDIAIGANATINLGANTFTVNRDYSQTNSTVNLGSGTLDVKRNFTRSGGTFTPGTSLVTFSGTAAAQTIDFSATGTSLNNVIFTGGGATFQKIFTAGRTLTVTNDYTVETSAQINLSAASATTHNIAGNFAYSGVTGASNIGSLTVGLTGSGKTINGSVLARPNGNQKVSSDRLDSKNILESRYIFIKGGESKNALDLAAAKGINFGGYVTSESTTQKTSVVNEDAKSLESTDRSSVMTEKSVGNEKVAPVITVEKPETPKYYTYERMKQYIDEMVASQKHNERLVFELEDATIIRNAPDFTGYNNTDAPTTTFEFNVNIGTTGSYTLSDNIAMNTARTLTVLGRLNCGTSTVGGGGNITVTGVSANNSLGVVGTANTSSAGFNNFTATGTINWTTGGATVGVVDYNAGGDQTINRTNHPANVFIMCSTSGTKTLDSSYSFTAISDCGAPGVTAALTKADLRVNAGATFADGGYTLRFPNSTSPWANVVVLGGFNSTGAGKMHWPQCYSSALYVVDGVTLGDLEVSFGGGSQSNGISEATGGVATFSARNMIFSGVGGASLWTLSIQGTTNINVTGNMSLIGAAENGGFAGTTGKTTYTRVAGNIISTATTVTQNIMSGAGTNIFELNGVAQQTLSVPITMNAVTFFTGSTLRLNNAAGVIITNDNPSTCTFTLGAAGTFADDLGSITMGDGDVFGYSATSTGSFSSGTINDINWPAVNGPQNVILGASATLPGDRTVPGTLTMNNGILNTGLNTLTIGTSGASVGAISYTGGAIRGNLRRWFGTATTTNTLFPMDDNSGQYVPGQISFTGAPSGAGTVTARFTSTGGGATGLPIIPGVSGSDSITTSSDAFWTFAAGDGLTGGTYSIDLTGTNFPGVTDFTILALLKRNDGASPWTWAPGNHITGTGSNTVPVIHGAGFTTFSDFALGGGGQGQNPLPVELSSFTSTINAQNVKLIWSTVHELNNSGFDIERAVKIGTELNWTKIGNVAGNGTVNTAQNYSYEDKRLQSGKYSYRLKQIDFNGNFHYYQLTNEVEIGVPVKFDLSQNYPNPFNPTTKIDYALPFDSKVSIRLFDMTGREVATIVNTTQTAGYHTINFNASHLSSGTYFYNIIAEGGSSNKFVATKKMMLVK